MTPYLWDPSWERERERLEAQALLFESGTIRLLESLGVRPGWRCLEVGAGTGSIAAWLSEKVGPSGHVHATDIDTRFLADIGQPNLDVRCHDIAAEPLEVTDRDLVHARLVLMHLPGRDQALRHLVAALRPGGWLLLEDYDLLTWGAFHPHSPLQARVAEAVRRLFEEQGADPRYGLKLPAALIGAGLANVQSEARLTVVRSGTPHNEALALKLEQFKDKLVAAGLLAAEEIAQAITESRAGSSAFYYPPLMVAAWGQRL
jgi:SAM-dependent methyltransferase